MRAGANGREVLRQRGEDHLTSIESYLGSKRALLSRKRGGSKAQGKLQKKGLGGSSFTKRGKKERIINSLKKEKFGEGSTHHT